MLASRFVAALGIWFHPDFFQQMPVLLPFVARDPSCRKRGTSDVEEWGASDKSGYFRDDNTLVKNLAKSLTIQSPRKNLYDGRRLGNGFVASHVWREIEGSSIGAKLSSRDPLTNTFIPNLVWLPKQVAKLTDREGSFTQLYLQALSLKIFRKTPVLRSLKSRVDKIWKMLPEPTSIPDQGLPDISELNFFVPTQRFIDGKVETIQKVIDAIHSVRKSTTIRGKIVSTRYGQSLTNVSGKALKRLGGELNDYLRELEY